MQPYIIAFFIFYCLCFCYSNEVSICNDILIQLDSTNITTENLFTSLCKAAEIDIRCQYQLGVYHFLGLHPLHYRNLTSAVLLWQLSADNGNADSQFQLSIFYNTFTNAPLLKISDEHKSHPKNEISFKYDYEALLSIHPVTGIIYFYDKNGVYRNLEALKEYERQLKFENEKIHTMRKNHSFSKHDFLTAFYPTYYNKQQKNMIVTTYLYSASIAGHTGSMLALGMRHHHGIGVQLSCPVASKYLLQISKTMIQNASYGIPQSAENNYLHMAPLDRFGLKFELILDNIEVDYIEFIPPLARRMLLGVDGFAQNYEQAFQFLNNTKQKSSEIFALLGYLYALGLGVSKDLDKAGVHFENALNIEDNAVALNGMAYIYFYGSQRYPLDLDKAVSYFKKAADLSSADAQYNLATLYLAGKGVPKSYEQAINWLITSLSNGHITASYSLALMHLHGFGVLKDCNIAISLLLRSCMAHPWITKSLQKAYGLYEAERKREAAFIFWQLAEAGHTASQLNLVHILTEKSVDLFFTDNLYLNEIFSQTYLEMASKQGSTSADFFLAQYAQNGKGIVPNVKRFPMNISLFDSEGESLQEWIQPYHVEYVDQKSDYEKAAEYYQDIVNQTIDIPSISNHRSRAHYYLGLMYLHGIGKDQDFKKAYDHILRISDSKNYYTKFISTIMKIYLYFYQFYHSYSKAHILKQSLYDWRIYSSFLLLFLLFCLQILKWTLKARIHNSHEE